MGFFNFLKKEKEVEKIDKSKLPEILMITDKNKFVIELKDYLDKKCAHFAKFDRLNNEEKTFYLCQIFEMEVNNGGFSQLLFNTSGNYIMEMLEALKTIKAYKTVSLLEELFSYFPNNQIPKERSERVDLCFDLDKKIKLSEKLLNLDDEFLKHEDNLLELNYNYVIENKEKFY